MLLEDGGKASVGAGQGGQAMCECLPAERAGPGAGLGRGVRVWLHYGRLDGLGVLSCNECQTRDEAPTALEWTCEGTMRRFA